MKKLYIIGNGFDRSHGMQSDFLDFHKYLEKNEPEILTSMGQFYNINDEQLWCDFEAALESKFDFKDFPKILTKNKPNYRNVNHSIKEYNDAATEVETRCNQLKRDIDYGFQKWIGTLKLPDSTRRKFHFETDSLFLTFNYTETLEKTYGILPENIIHIHNKIGEELIIGHGANNNTIKQKINSNNFCSKIDKKNQQFETLDDEPNLHESHALFEVSEFLKRLRKDTDKQTRINTDFFNKISDIETIEIIGYSYNNIDIEYFTTIIDSLENKDMVTWIFCYHTETDMSAAEKYIENLLLAREHVQLKEI